MVSFLGQLHSGNRTINIRSNDFPNPPIPPNPHNSQADLLLVAAIAVAVARVALTNI